MKVAGPRQEEVEKAGHGGLLPHCTGGSPPHTLDTEWQRPCPKPTPEVQEFGRWTEDLERPNWRREMGGSLELVISVSPNLPPNTKGSSLPNLSVPAPPLPAPAQWDYHQLLEDSLSPCLHLPLLSICHRTRQQSSFQNAERSCPLTIQ